MTIPQSNTPHGSILCTLHGLSYQRYTSSEFENIIDFNIQKNNLSIYTIFNSARIEYNYLHTDFTNMYGSDRHRYIRIIKYFLDYMIESYGETNPEIRI